MNKEQFIEELAKINIQISSSQLNQLSVKGLSQFFL